MKWENPFSIIDPRMNAHGFYSWSFDPMLPVDVRFYSYSKRTNFRLNRHDYFEVVYITEGAITFQVHQQSFKVRAGSLIVIGSTLFHRPVRYGPSPNKSVSLYFLPQAVLGEKGEDEGVEYLMPFLAQDANFPHLVPARTGIPEKVIELIKLIYAELPAKSVRARLNARTYLKMILVLLGNHYADYHVGLREFRRKQENIKRLRPVLDFLDEHFAEVIMVSEMASMAEMSRSNFIRFFTKVTGQTFVAYVTHLRVAKAQRLLAATNLPIAELCQQVGFCDQSYFGMVFRKAVGMPPGQYRRRYSGTAVEDTHAHHTSGLGQDNLIPESISASEKRSPAGHSNPAKQLVMKPGEFVQ